MSTWQVEASPAERLREQLAAMNPEERHLQRLEWKWQRSLEKWTQAAIKVQAVFRGYKTRRDTGEARQLVTIARQARDMSNRALLAFQESDHSNVVRFLSDCDRNYLTAELRLVKAKSLYAIAAFSACIQECDDIAESPPHNITEETQSHFTYLCATAHAKLEHWGDVLRLTKLLQAHESLGTIAKVLQRLAQWKKDSLAYYEKVRAGEARLGSSSDLNGCACAVYQNWDKAMEYLNKAIAEHPINDELYCLRARLNFCLRAYDAARADYEHALKLQPSNARAKEGIAQLDYVPNKYPMVTAKDVEDQF